MFGKATGLCIPAFLTLLIAVSPTCADAVPVSVSEAKKNVDGSLVHEVRSPYQAGITQIKVLLPDPLEKKKRYPVIFVLPVEAGNEKPLWRRNTGGAEERPPQQTPGHLR